MVGVLLRLIMLGSKLSVLIVQELQVILRLDRKPLTSRQNANFLL